MARRLTWSDVRGGLIACVAIVVAIAGIFKFSHVGALHGDTFALHALVAEARGVTKGSEVWLSGQKIGKITNIYFRPPGAADTTQRIAIDMEILDRYRDALRRDAVAQIRSGGSPVGPPVVYLSPGTAGAAPMRGDDTIHARRQIDTEGAAAQFSGATKELPAIVANVKLLRAQLRTTRSAIDGVVGGREAGALRLAGSRMTQLRRSFDGGGDGTVGRLMDGSLAVRTRQVLARSDSVRALLASSGNALGRFRRDSTLVADVADIRNELALVRARLDASDGTAGLLLNDSSLTSALANSQHEMTLLFADMKKHPFRYISF
jgi:phospholipid/cholesterol/gamma-HCH transport system substrate-binding protein